MKLSIALRLRILACTSLVSSVAQAGEVVVSRQSPDAWLPGSAILQYSAVGDMKSDGSAYSAPVTRTGGTETISGSSFVVPGSGSFTLSSLTFRSADTRSFPRGAILDMALYLNAGDSGSGDSAIERGEALGGITDSFDLSYVPVVKGGHISFNLETPVTGLQRGREYAVLFRWRSARSGQSLALWRSNSNNRRDGGALWDNNSSNVSPFPGRDPSIATNNDPVMWIASSPVTPGGDGIARGTMEPWGVHRKYAADEAGYFATGTQQTGKAWWDDYKIIDSNTAATETVASQVEHDAGTEVAKVIVPEAYDPANPIGLVIFVNSGDSTYFPDSYTNLLETQYLIGASPARTGNSRHDPWRIARTLDLTVSLMDEYEIDPRRVYVAGSSGGALISAMCALLYPDLYTGAACHAHGFPATGGLYGTLWSYGEWDEFAAQRQRFAWTAGEDDGSAWFFERSHADWAFLGFFMDVYWVPNTGHGKPSAAVFEEAVAFIDASERARSITNYDAWRSEILGGMFGQTLGEPFHSYAAGDDPDGDGRSFVEEFVFGGNPIRPDTADPAPGIEAGELRVRCRHPLTGADLEVLWGETPSTDSAAPAPLSELAPLDAGDGYMWRRFEITGGPDRAFFRFTAKEAP